MDDSVIIKAELNILVNNKEEIIRKIIEKGIKIDAIKPDAEKEIFDAFIKREKQGTTGLVDGYAIPHAESTKINKSALIIYKLKESVKWESMDGEPINFIFGMLIPSKSKSTAHLKILSEVAKMLMKDDAKNALSLASSEKEILEAVKEYTSIQ